MQAQEIDVEIQVEAVLNISTASAVVLKVKGPSDDDTRDLTMTPAGTVATRDTLSTDFPVAGNYRIQLEATFASGKVLKSAVFPLQIGGAL